MNVAKAVRLDREAHPERFCSFASPPCMWRLRLDVDVDGRCPKHRLPAPLPERLLRYSLIPRDE